MVQDDGEDGLRAAGVLDRLGREEEAPFVGGRGVVGPVRGGGGVGALGAGYPFEEEDYAVDGAVVFFLFVNYLFFSNVWKESGSCISVDRWIGGGAHLNARIVSASSEMSSSNWTPFTPRFSIREVKTPYTCRYWVSCQFQIQFLIDWTTIQCRARAECKVTQLQIDKGQITDR